MLRIILFLLRYTQKGNLEVQMFILTSNLRENHQKMYSPPEGKMISDINKVKYFAVLTKVSTVVVHSCASYFIFLTGLG